MSLWAKVKTYTRKADKPRAETAGRVGGSMLDAVLCLALLERYAGKR